MDQRPAVKATQKQDYYCDTPENIREVRPFHWLLLAILAAMYGWAVYSSPALQPPFRLISFTALMLIHAGLHWIGPLLTTRRRWLLPYFLVQGALVFGLSLLVQHQGVVMGLYLALAGEAVGILEDVGLSTLAVVGYLGLSVANFAALWGWADVSGWLFWMGPLALLIATYAAMFIRQARARDRAQTLLRELETAHHELETAHRQLADYAERVEALTLESERQRLARELHDTLAQGIAGLILQLHAADRFLQDGNPVRAQAVVQQAVQRAKTALHDARCAIQDLRPAPLEAGNLLDALREEVDRFAATTAIPTSFEVDGGSPLSHLTPEMAQEILRIVQESLTNVARHARASHVLLQIAAAGEGVQVVVQDDGLGFDPSEGHKRSGRFGLVGMQERAQRIGGELRIESAPGQGTRLTLMVGEEAA